MEFNEKLKELRKNKGLTQEELAEALFVSRTAISKWESGRGYPGIDSLKELAGFFSVSIDELLTGDKLITIAEKENNSNIQSLCSMIMGIVDLSSFLLIVLPLYPNPVNGYISSVNLPDYSEKTSAIRIVYWVLFLSLIVIGLLKSLLTYFKIEKGQKATTAFSIGISILTVLVLSMTREAYAVTVAFILLIIKVVLLFKISRTQ
ncbi:MAG: helix-turn-helix transcriptional regulator [Anaerolineaceae bacterium]|nr:helix-turn-helix transcriptional regulator [Anaerolineaceae bacterium]